MSHAYDERDANLLGALGLAVADRLADAGAGGSAAEALVALHGKRAGSTIDALARVTSLTHSGTVRLVDRLARDELLERRRGPDQRSIALYLTPAGHREARRVLTQRGAAMHSLLSLLTGDQRSVLTAATEQILGALGAAPNAERRLCRLCDVESCGRSQGRCPVVLRRAPAAEEIQRPNHDSAARHASEETPGDVPPAKI